MTFDRRSLALLSAVLVLLVAGVYWPGLSGGWIFDDDGNNFREASIHAERVDADLFVNAVQGFHNGTGRPIAMITFALDHAFWGLDPWGFKLTSLVVHVLNALLVFALVRRLLALAWPARDTRAIMPPTLSRP